MKKLVFSAIALVAFSATIMAGEINSSKPSIAIEEKISENSVFEKETVSCSYTSTTIFYRMAVKKVISMDTDVSAFEVTMVIDRICTTCYQMGHAGVTATTSCN